MLPIVYVAAMSLILCTDHVQMSISSIGQLSTIPI
jgi:hypothetical protein